jgi:hypothetical protein
MAIDLDFLEELVDHAMQEWPDLIYRSLSGNRATAAADYVRQGLVEFIEETPALIDHWCVNGHHCSWHSKLCDCKDDTAPRDPDLGRLCKHRLAVMFTRQLKQAELAQLARIFSLCNQGAVRAIKWTVRTRYANSLARQETTLLAWQPAGYALLELVTPIQFTIRQLRDILHGHRWRVAPGKRINQNRHILGKEHWFFEPQPAATAKQTAEIATLIGHLYGIDALMAEERARRAAFLTMFENDLRKQAV